MMRLHDWTWDFHMYFCHIGSIFVLFLLIWAELEWDCNIFACMLLVVLQDCFIFDLDGGTWLFLVVSGWIGNMKMKDISIPILIKKHSCMSLHWILLIMKLMFIQIATLMTMNLIFMPAWKSVLKWKRKQTWKLDISC